MKRSIESIFGSMRTFLMLAVLILVALCVKAFGLDDLTAGGVMAMTLAADKALEYTEGVEVPFPVINADILYAGSNICVNTAGYALPGSDTAGLIYAGVAVERVDNSTGNAGDKQIRLRRRGLVKMTLATAITQANVGDNVFLVDDETVDLTANVTNKIFCGIIAVFIDTTHAYIDIEPAIKQADVATHIADASGAHSASAISVADAGTFTEATEVEAALQEIYQHLKSAKGIIQIPMPVITSAGAALAAFADGDSVTPGFCVTAKGLGIRWNNHATPGAVGSKVIVPPDMDVTANAVLHILAAKTGATVGDATKFTIGAFNNVKDAAYDADLTFGGDTGAMVGDDTAKHIQEVTLALALADLAAYPAAIELTIKPKDGTLGTDDVIMLAAWIEYKKKLLTA
ncbi:MAG: hypothetical protein EG826_04460 [Deltaproteobacteria bacterium]|nr:hypothetical protein [Deltaproteobacteria bacterium]